MYLLNGDVEYLDKAIEYIQECFQLQSQKPLSEAHDFVDLVNSFALMMRSKFDEYGELRDLDIAIEHIQDFLNGMMLFIFLLTICHSLTFGTHFVLRHI